ncbi:MAG: ATP-dependent 6-phosphofructokinase [Deltaproteobacteria bacterium]|nr:ATP-dependent 6-phosphofructokinase [Deltaproteobacteria bacterium]
MEIEDLNLEVERLGKCTVPSPMDPGQFVCDDDRVLYSATLKEANACIEAARPLPSFEMAGPREKIYFDPSKLKCGIVTCGGICPGLNDVIRAIVLSLHHHYQVSTVYGFRFGYEGISSRYRHVPLELDPKAVEDIHEKGGTILGSSRGPQDISDMVDTLERMNIRLLFTIGGDGTLRGAQAISEEIGRRGLKIGIVGIPKTIDNDISFVDQSFGFETAVSAARSCIYAAHVEARGARNGVGLVKLMGRESGFIAAYATLATSDVNFCLVPEVPFTLERFFPALKEKIARSTHSVIVVAEGAGQNLLNGSGARDASGNPRFEDIGIFLRDEIRAYFKREGVEMHLKYIDPSYIIRSVPANPKDSVFCLLLGHNAVHAGMAGRTNTLVGYWDSEYTHVPIPMAVSERKRIDPKGRLWSNVVESTGQPRDLADPFGKGENACSGAA